MKKLLSLSAAILCFALLLSLSAAPAYAEQAVPNGSTSVGYYLFTDYGYYYVPTDTVVGFNNITSGTYVRAAQAALTHIDDHYSASCNPGGIDGYFGYNTYYAVQYFQTYAGITSDGYVGNQTWSYLSAYC